MYSPITDVSILKLGHPQYMTNKYWSPCKKDDLSHTLKTQVYHIVI